LHCRHRSFEVIQSADELTINTRSSATAEIARVFPIIYSVLPKLESQGYMFVDETVDVASANLTQSTQKPVVSCKITSAIRSF